jgi:hypothetical protein
MLDVWTALRTARQVPRVFAAACVFTRRAAAHGPGKPERKLLQKEQ